MIGYHGSKPNNAGICIISGNMSRTKIRATDLRIFYVRELPHKILPCLVWHLHVEVLKFPFNVSFFISWRYGDNIMRYIPNNAGT